MRARLKRGRLIPPSSLVQGFERLKLLEVEVTRIKEQLNENKNAGLDWRKSALSAHTLFDSEHRQLTSWLSFAMAEPHGAKLFYEAYKMLDTLRNEVDLDKHEIEWMIKLDSFFTQNKPNPKPF